LEIAVDAKNLSGFLRHDRSRCWQHVGHASGGQRLSRRRSRELVPGASIRRDHSKPGWRNG